MNDSTFFRYNQSDLVKRYMGLLCPDFVEGVKSFDSAFRDANLIYSKAYNYLYMLELARLETSPAGGTLISYGQEMTELKN